MKKTSCSLCGKFIETDKMTISEEHLVILTSLKIFESTEEDYLTKFLCSTCNQKLCEIETWIKSCQIVQKNFPLIKNESEIEIEPIFVTVDENEMVYSPEEKDMLEDCVKVPNLQAKFTNTNKKQYTCTDCAEVFSGKTIYRNHRKCCTIRGTSDSRRNQNYTCESENCGKVLKSLVGFNAHTAMHRRQKTSTPINEIKELTVLLCSICGKTFKQKQALEVHILNHQNLKPFECKICSNSYFTQVCLFCCFFNKKIICFCL